MNAGTHTVHAVCSHDCPDSCGVLVTVDTLTGRATRVAGDPAHPVTRGFLCGKVAKYLDRVYAPDRLLYPMRRRPGVRKGPLAQGREADAFERISWDTALDEIAIRLQQVSDQYGPESILPYSYAGTIGQLGYASMDRRFFHRLGASQLDRTICASAGGEALLSVYGVKLGTTPQNFAHAGLIIAWGANIHGNNVHLWPFIEEARRRGAKLVVIDPYRTRTAALADQHLAIRPGTDGLLALGLMHVILRDGLEDRAYLDACTRGFGDLRTFVLQPKHTPVAVAEITGIPAEIIVDLAHSYATVLQRTCRPAVIRLNYGVNRSENGGTSTRAVAMLPLLIGAWQHLGGGLQLSMSGSFPFNSSALQMPELMHASPLGRPARTVNMSQLGRALTLPDAGLGGPPVHALFVYNSNPAAVAPNGTDVLRGLARPDLFTVVHEQFFTDTTDFADIVLPAPTFLETRDVQGAYGHLFAGISEPAIAPLGESRSNVDLFAALAQRMGFPEPCFHDTDLDLIDQALQTDDPRFAGITRGRLEAEKHIELQLPKNNLGASLPFSTPDWFRTASGRAELTPVPAFYPPTESRASTDLIRSYPLEFLPRKADNYMNSTFANLPTHQRMEARTAGILEMHATDAEARGVRTGDPVEIFNSRGSIQLHAHVNGTVPRRRRRRPSRLEQSFPSTAPTSTPSPANASPTSAAAPPSTPLLSKFDDSLRTPPVPVRKSLFRPPPPAFLVVTPAGNLLLAHDPHRTNRNRIAPFAVDASTTTPPCVTTTLPAATSRRAAARAGSINVSHPSGATARAASEGQIVFPAPRSPNNRTIAASSATSCAPGFCPRHPSEQNFTASQFRSHFFRHAMRRPHAAHTLSACAPSVTASAFRRLSGIAPIQMHLPILRQAMSTSSPTPTPFSSVEDQLDLITKGAAEIIPPAPSDQPDALRIRLADSLRTGTPLRIKAGFDPTAPDLHLGHTVLMRKLRHFQQLGHTVIFLIGDATALIGDPTGKDVTRKPLTREEILANAGTYQEQVFKILDRDRTEVRWNSEWLDQLGFEGLIRLAAKVTVSQMLEREHFHKRFQAEQPISVHELLYPMVQGYDSVMLRSDVELGGTDQRFNLMRGRDLQRDAGQKPQIVLMTPILEGLDGVQKMSKSLGNAIGIHEPAPEMYGKLMSISDDLMWRYWTLLTDLRQTEIEAMEAEVASGALHPMQAKKNLAHTITADFHGAAEADRAAEGWAQQFQQKGVAEDLPVAAVNLQDPKLSLGFTADGTTPLPPGHVLHMPRLLVLSGLSSSNGEAARKLDEKAVSINGEKFSSKAVDREVLGDSPVLRLGKRSVRVQWT